MFQIIGEGGYLIKVWLGDNEGGDSWNEWINGWMNVCLLNCTEGAWKLPML